MLGLPRYCFITGIAPTMKALGKGGPKVSSDAGTWGKGPSSQCFLSPLTAELMLRMTPGYDITEPPTLSQERKGHEAAAVGVGMGVAGWAGGRGNRWEAALGAAGRGQSWGEGSICLRSWEAEEGPSSPSTCLLPSSSFAWRAQLIPEKLLEQNQAPSQPR